MTSHTVNIKNGPSKFDLMTALFVRNPCIQWVLFTDDKNQTYEAALFGCAAADSSGEVWDLTGFVGIGFVGDTRHPNCRFKAHFWTNTREGQLEYFVT